VLLFDRPWGRIRLEQLLAMDPVLKYTPVLLLLGGEHSAAGLSVRTPEKLRSNSSSTLSTFLPHCCGVLLCPPAPHHSDPHLPPTTPHTLTPAPACAQDWPY
jgi:hypothetical protein